MVLSCIAMGILQSLSIRFIGKVGSSRIRGHANIVGLDFEKFITTLGSRLKVLHIHDNDSISDLHQIPFTFTRTRENLTRIWHVHLIYFNPRCLCPLLMEPKEMLQFPSRLIKKII